MTISRSANISRGASHQIIAPSAPIAARTGHVHKQIAEVAKAAAAELFETLMSDNYNYDLWKRKHPGKSERALRQAFVDANWGKCIALAKATMAQLLTSPTIDPAVKDEIMDVLTLDASLQRGRGNVGRASRVLGGQ